MTTSKTIIAFFITLLATACTSESERELEQQGADLILSNARVYTMRWDEPASDGTLANDAPHDGRWAPDADAIAVKGGDIVFVGSTKEAMAMRGDDTRVVDLAGATVLPGLVDSHTHVFRTGCSPGARRPGRCRH